MSASFANDPDFNAPVPKPRSRRQFRLVELLIVIAIIALLIALLLPATRGAGEAARRSQCVNNLKQIALALHNYEQAHGVLPPAYTVDSKGRPLHSWRTLILPYLEQQQVYDSIDLSKPWNDPANAKALATPVWAYHCPSSVGSPTTTTYLALVGPNACLLPTQPRRLADITDAHASTLMVIEAGEEQAVPWMAPLDAGEPLLLGFGPTTKVHHSGGMNACLVDGSVRFLKTTVRPRVFRALMTISGNDAPSSDEY